MYFYNDPDGFPHAGVILKSLPLRRFSTGTPGKEKPNSKSALLSYLEGVCGNSFSKYSILTIDLQHPTWAAPFTLNSYFLSRLFKKYQARWQLAVTCTFQRCSEEDKEPLNDCYDITAWEILNVVHGGGNTNGLAHTYYIV